jgi:Ca-activated chloride channel family protein
MTAQWFRGFMAGLAVAAGFLAAAAVGDAAAADIRVLANFDNPMVFTSQPDDRYLEIEVVAPEGEAWRSGVRRPPLNIALVIDKSGSMAEARKIDFVKEAARALVEQLQYGDRFALVTYDDGVQVPIPSEAVEDKRRAFRVIDQIWPGGATNLGGGLAEGFRQVRSRHNPEGINRVLLLSDGLANRGITAPDELSSLVGSEAESGTSLTTFGVGLEFNEDLLAGLGESGRGTYYYIDHPARIPDMLAHEFSALQRLYASDVQISIELHAEVVIRDVLGYAFRRDGNRWLITLGSLSAGERRRVMCRVAPPRWSPGMHRIGEAVVRYQPAGGRGSRSSSQELKLNWMTDSRRVREGLNREVSERSTVNEANVARQKAAKMVDKGDVAGAKKALEESRQKLEAAPVQSEAVRQELKESAGYGQAISAPMAPAERSAVQKDVKYKSYKTLQQK